MKNKFLLASIVLLAPIAQAQKPDCSGVNCPTQDSSISDIDDKINAQNLLNQQPILEQIDA